MSDFVMTIDDEMEQDQTPQNHHEDDSADSGSDDEAGAGFSFQFDGSGLGAALDKAPLPWDFASARKNLLDRNRMGTTVDTKIQALLESKKAKGGKNAETKATSASSDDEEEDGASGEESGEEAEEGDDSMDQDDEGEDGESGDMDVDEEDEEEADEEDAEGEDDENEDEEDIYQKHRFDDEDEEEQVRDIQRKETKKTKREKEAKDKLVKAWEALQSSSTFESLSLSRPILKALTDLGFSHPTAIQLQTIPLALAGKDICGSATTGSGKTAAFVLPCLERLLYRDTRVAATRVLILTPTRELAVQCHSVVEKMAKYTNGITAALVAGGMSLKKQEIELSHRPDIVVATPGRVVDHLLNTKAFGLDDLEILIIDEADRLLELGFAEQVEQIIKLCPPHRQTMLFSATMTDRVDRLISMSLKEPARVSVDPMFQVAKRLHQEFVRIRQAKDIDREAIVLALCKRTFKTRTVIFCMHKHTAHRLKIIFALVGLKAAELHGNLTQEERLDALENFRDEKCDFLIASDVAARGLDILGIQTVINYNLPPKMANYVHRVGRTARAGKEGRAVSLVGEDDRKLFKEIVRHAPGKLKQRVVAPEIIEQYRARIEAMQSDLQRIFDQEREEKAMRLAEMEAQKTENMILHEEEIMSRPKRTWFITETEKENQRERSTRIAKGLAADTGSDSDDDADDDEIDPDAEEDLERIKKTKRINGKKPDGAGKKRKREEFEADDAKSPQKKMRGVSKQVKKRKLARSETDFGSQKSAQHKNKKGVKVQNKESTKKKGAVPMPSLPPDTKGVKRSTGSLFGREMKTARVTIGPKPSPGKFGKSAGKFVGKPAGKPAGGKPSGGKSFGGSKPGFGKKPAGGKPSGGKGPFKPGKGGSNKFKRR